MPTHRGSSLAQLQVPRASCDLVARDGNWTRDFEWSVPGLRSYVRVLPSCLQSRNRSAACIDVNVPLLRGLRNRTLLLVGDSTSARTFEFACSWLGATTSRAWLPRPPHQRGYRASFTAAEHLCEVPGGGPVIGHFLHYGAVGPPYFDANPGSIGVSWVGNTTARQVRENLPSFCRATTACASGSPSLIVANSLLWDASNWAQHRSTPRTRKRANEEPTARRGRRVWRQCEAKGLASVPRQRAPPLTQRPRIILAQRVECAARPPHSVIGLR